MENKIFEATIEGRVMAKEIRDEIKLLMEDYFAGETYIFDNAVLYVMPNGQRFTIKVKKM